MKSFVSILMAMMLSQPLISYMPIFEEAPVPIKTVTPIMPYELSRKISSGFVIVIFSVLEDGTTGQISVLKSTHPDLDSLAVKAARQWRFIPAKKKGEPFQCMVKQKINFTRPNPVIIHTVLSTRSLVDSLVRFARLQIPELIDKVVEIKNSPISVATLSNQLYLTLRPVWGDSPRKAFPDFREYFFARDPLAVIVHPTNPVDSLTLDQLKALFTGIIKNWSELGGRNRIPVILSIDRNKALYSIYSQVVLRGASLTRKAVLYDSEEDILQWVRLRKNAIGLVPMRLVDSRVKVLAIDGVCPSEENPDRYPLFRNLYLSIRGQPDDYSRRFLEIVLSPEGQAFLRSLGYIPEKNP